MNIVKDFHNCKAKIEGIKLDIWFNTQCKINNFTPRYINIFTKNNSLAAKTATRIAKKEWLNAEIRNLHARKQYLVERMYYIHLEMGKFDLDSKFDYLFGKHEDHLNEVLYNKRHILQGKLNTLEAENLHRNALPKAHNTTVQVKRNHTHAFHQRTVNLSNVSFTHQEMTVFDMGHKYNFKGSYNNNTTIKEVITECEAVAKMAPTEEVEHFRHLLTEQVRLCQKSQNRNPMYGDKHSIIKTSVLPLKDKIELNNLIVTKADKGNATVIMDKQDYIDKTVEFLTSNNIQVLDKDPTQTYQKNIKDSLKGIKLVLKDKDKKLLVNMNPSPPILKAFPKVHKEHVPIRPIINFRTAPAYKLAKFLQVYLHDNFIYKQPHISSKSSVEFANNIVKQELADTHRLMSLDIVNMYANIPNLETVDIVEQNLLHVNSIPPDEVNEILILLRLTLKQSYFTFNNKVYTQECGLPMGSPLSGILASIFMDAWEDSFLNKHVLKDVILDWSRYVDDVFLIYDNRFITDTLILECANNEHHNIIFTKESEKDKKLQHLDLTLTRSDHSIEVDIYRKPTTTDHTIHFTSNHPYSHKLAAYNYFANRMFTLPLSQENIAKETNTIKQIAQANGFNHLLIDKIIRKHQLKHKKQTVSKLACKQNKVYVPFTFVNDDTYKLTNWLKHHGLTPAFSTKHNLKKSLHNNIIEDFNRYDRSGVYKLQCQHSGCTASYIGQTGRAFKTRYREHTRGVKNDNQTAFAEHVLETDHTFTNMTQDMEVLHFSKKGSKLNTLEALEINKDVTRNPYNLNDRTYTNNNILFSLVR